MSQEDMVAISRAIHMRDWAHALTLLQHAGVEKEAAREFLAFEMAGYGALPDHDGRL